MKIIEKKAVTLDLPVFKDENGDIYEPTEEFRQVKRGEYFKFSDMAVKRAQKDMSTDRHIYEKRRWRAENGCKYFAIRFSLHQTRFEVFSTTDSDCVGDNAFYSMGNYYATEQEAKAVADKLNKKIEHKALESFKEMHQINS